MFLLPWTPKRAHFWQRGAIQGGATDVFGGQLPQSAPMDPPLLGVAFHYQYYTIIDSI